MVFLFLNVVFTSLHLTFIINNVWITIFRLVKPVSLKVLSVLFFKEIYRLVYSVAPQLLSILVWWRTKPHIFVWILCLCEIWYKNILLRKNEVFSFWMDQRMDCFDIIMNSFLYIPSLSEHIDKAWWFLVSTLWP